MFRKLQKVWRQEGLLKQVLETIKNMFEEDKNIFKIATEALMEKKEASQDVYQEDKIINKFEIEIRKKILEHLSVNPQQDVIASLILLGVARDTERIGDFSKNIYELAQMHPGKFDQNQYTQTLKEIRNKLVEVFDLTYLSFSESKKEEAQEVMDTHHHDIAKRLDRMIERIAADEEIKTRQAVVYVLLDRYFKRISAHLANIASAVVNPFHRVRYTEEKDNNVDL